MTERDLVGPLQAAIRRADSTWVNQPSHLRRRLEEELGADARRHRAQIHQLVVAAEERIPIRLKRNGWSPGERSELGHLLVVTRGWTAAASDWAVTTWAAALGLTDEHPAAPSATAHPRSEPPPNVRPTQSPSRGGDELSGATEIPSELFAKATDMPSAQFIEATELPSDHRVGATEVAGGKSPAPATAPRRLPKRGTRGCTRKTARFLDHELDVAYVVKVGPTPALLLLALPIGLAGFVLPALSGVLLMVFMLIIVFGSALWPARILAIKGNDVWLLSKKKGLSMKPKAVLAQGTRSQIAFAGGRPFPSVRFAGQRLWFQYPITGAARRLPTAHVGEAQQ